MKDVEIAGCHDIIGLLWRKNDTGLPNVRVIHSITYQTHWDNVQHRVTGQIRQVALSLRGPVPCCEQNSLKNRTRKHPVQSYQDPIFEPETLKRC